MKPSTFVSWFCATALLILSVLIFTIESQYQKLLTPFIVSLSVLFAFSWCVSLAREKGRGGTDWFHPAVLFSGMYLIYFVFSGLWLWLRNDYDSEFVALGANAAFVGNETFFLGFVSLAAYGLGARFRIAGLNLPRRSIPHSIIRRPAAERSRSIDEKELLIVALVLFPLGLAFKIYHLAQFGALSTDILLYLSPSAANELGLSISQFVIMMESMLDWAALLAVLYAIVRYKKTGNWHGLWWVIGAVVVVALLDYVISGKRSAVIFFIVLPVLWYHYLVKRLTARMAGALSLGLIFAVVILLMGRIVLPLLIQGLVPTDYIGVNPLDVFAFYLNSGEISTFDMVAATIQQKDELLRQSGGTLLGFLQFTFSSLIVFIPRLIWPDKPAYLDLSQIYRRVLIGSEEDMGIAPTVWGAGYLFFDVAGFVVLMFVIGWAYESVYRYLRPRNAGVANVVLYSIGFWVIFQAIRFGTLGFVTLLIVQSMLVGIVAMWFLGRRRKPLIT
jgi:oligosaccharide repeat unit polymerase